MNIQINNTLTPFRDKEGQYVEVLSILPSKVVLLYALEKLDEAVFDAKDLKVGDKLYFSEDGSFKKVVGFIVQPSSSGSNKQSPSRKPIDPSSRY